MTSYYDQPLHRERNIPSLCLLKNKFNLLLFWGFLRTEVLSLAEMVVIFNLKVFLYIFKMSFKCTCCLGLLMMIMVMCWMLRMNSHTLTPLSLCTVYAVNEILHSHLMIMKMTSSSDNRDHYKPV